MPRGRPRKTDDNVLLKSAELIGWALGGLEREIVVTKTRLTSLNAQAATLRTRLGKRGAGALHALEGAMAQGKRKRRKMSREARKRISEMMKKRWAERKKK